jgi:hypothetical protein
MNGVLNTVLIILEHNFRFRMREREREREREKYTDSLMKPNVDETFV